jgi:NADPH2:quinone reductase
MHAWLCENPTGVDELQWKELPTPEPKAGEVCIEIKAASLNFPDLLIVQNKYQMKPPLPFVPGSEYAGVIQAVGGWSQPPQSRSACCLPQWYWWIWHPYRRSGCTVHATA